MAEKNLNGLVAIITGASTGLGFEIAFSLAGKGVQVNLIARDRDKLEEARRKIEESGGNAVVYPGDVTNLDAIKLIINDVYQQKRRLDIFVNNAGEWKLQSVGTNVEELRRMRALTRDAPTEIMEYLVHRFGDVNQELKILNVVSQAGWKFLPGNLGYGAGKKGLAINMLELQGEMDHLGIGNVKIYGIYPGTFGTPGTIEAIRRGELQNATTIESVVATALDLLFDETPSRHAYVGFVPGRGIVRRYLEFNPETYLVFPQLGEDHVVDAGFNPRSLVE